MIFSDTNIASVVAQQSINDTEIALIGVETPGTETASVRSMLLRSVTLLFGHIAYGRAFRPLIEVIAASAHFGPAPDSKHSNMTSRAARHARIALRHAALARTTLLTVVVWCTLVAVTLLAHETHNTERIYQKYLANPTVARAPQRAWGYTPLLSDLPYNLKTRLVAFDRSFEYRLRAFGVGRSKSGSSSVGSIKIGSTILSLFGLIPLVQFGLGQHVESQRRREKAIRITAMSRAR